MASKETQMKSAMGVLSEQQARERKAMMLMADYLVREFIKTVGEADEDTWIAIAAKSGCNPPHSQETKDKVIQTLKLRCL